MDERTNILRILSDRKIFLIKGAVPRVARMLGCSEPTVYRGIKSCEAMNGPPVTTGLKLKRKRLGAARVHFDTAHKNRRKRHFACGGVAVSANFEDR